MADERPHASPGGAERAFHSPAGGAAGTARAGGSGAHAPALLRALRSVGQSLARPAEVQSLLRVIVEQSVALTGADAAYIALPEPSGRALRVRVATDVLAAQEGVVIPLNSGLEGIAYRTGGLQVVADLASDRRVYRARSRALPPGCAVALPLVSDGTARALLLLLSRNDPGCTLGTRLGPLQEVAGLLAAAVENVQRYARARRSEEALQQWRTERWLRFWIRGYERITELLGAVGFAWNGRNDRLLWGGALQPVFGFTPREFGLSLDAWARHLPPGERESTLRALRAAAGAGAPLHLSVRLRDAEGEERRVAMHLVPAGPSVPGRMLGVLVDEGGSAPGPVPFRGETDPASSLVQLLQHEINNPLAVVLAQAQLLLLDADDPARAGVPLRPALEAIYRHGQRIAEVVRRIPQLLPEAYAPAARPAAAARTSPEVEMEFRAILESLAEGVMVLDAARAVRYANTSAATLLGTTPGALLERDLLATIPPGDTRNAVSDHLARTLAGAERTSEIRLPRAGVDLWLELESRPMRSAAGEVVGVVAMLADVSERHERERMIREAALLDPLTALPNRTLLSERITHASARARRHPEVRFAVLFLDVDHLKWVNDSFGHAAGDELLTAVAGRLRACVRPEDTLARIGGDEFAVLLEGIEDSTDATRVCERILGELAKPIQVADLEMSTSASIGIVVESSSNRGPDELLRDADAAMYRAKALGGGRCEIFDRELQRLVSSRLTAEQELRRAVERDELVLHYQPIVALGTRQVVGLEALLRWQHPERGLLPPAEFISIAEGTNLILPIGRWVLSTACGQLHEWRARYFDRAPRWVAVNLSSKQFLQPGLLAQVKQALREASLRPDELRLEITESTVSQNSGVATGILAELTALGIRVNMDDFGTGYSSLGSLYHLPIEALKIDRSFVSDLRPEHGSDHLVRTIVSVAQGVGASTIAEGISTNEQLGELRRLGCQYGQGYLFSRPLTVEQVEPLLRANPGAGVL